MKNYLIYGFAFCILACSAKKDHQSLAIGKGIVGLASPIKLNYGKTTVYLLDYFEKPELIDSLQMSQGLNYVYFPDSAVIHVESDVSPLPLAELNVFSGGITYSIPVFGSSREAFEFSYRPTNPAITEVGLKGNFNGWNAKANPLKKSGESWTTTLFLDPGLYEYLVVEGQNEMLDANNSEKKSNGNGGFNSILRVGKASETPIISTFGISHDSIILVVPESIKEPLILIQNQKLDAQTYSRKGDRLALKVPSISAGSSDRLVIRVFAANEQFRSNDLFIPLHKGKPVSDASQLTRNDHQAWSMYFMMVDRFLNGDSTIDQPVNDAEIKPVANYYGGDIRGVEQKIKEGYFNEIGVNTIWLSPITQNPLGAYGLWDKGGVRSKFSGYHGYWPISSSHVDTRFGDSLALATMLQEAHSKEFNVLLDYVANHVHQEHPVYKAHPEWATNLYLPDGSLNTERWDEYRLTTWFDTFMPTLDLEKDEVVAAMTDSALYWFKNFPIDGFRHDATKHIPLKFWRELTRKLKYEIVVPDNRTIYQIGETYGNPELIGSYVGSGLLDAQFDFNLYDAAVAAFAYDKGDLSQLKRVLLQSLNAYGYHHLMGNISGNQDRTRFISFADGSVSPAEDVKLAGWTRRIEIRDTIGYNRLLILHAFNFTVPGIPVIYYGDEIGMPGANDPDNRRMMRFGEDLSSAEKATLSEVSKLVKLRASHLALLYGDMRILDQTDDYIIYMRNYFDKTALVCLHTGKETHDVRVKLPEIFANQSLKAQFGSAVQEEEGEIVISLKPVSFEILTN